MNSDRWTNDRRLAGLRRFATAITVLNLIGHFFLGFEQSWAQPLVALATAYSFELGLEWLDARSRRRAPGFSGGGMRGVIDFFLSAHITGLAVSMLMYANSRLAPIAFGVAAALVSKRVFRVSVAGKSRHFLNPSNFGITTTLLLLPWVGIAPPYQFTENVAGSWDWLLPLVIVCTGSLLNALLTERIWVIASWLAGFALQAVARSALLDASIAAALAPMTGFAFVLYTFYMVTDPATTPSTPAGQALFGFSVAMVYGLLVSAHVVFGLFFALTLVCAARGAGLSLLSRAPHFSRAASVLDRRGVS